MQPFVPIKMNDINLDFVKLIPLISKSNSSLSNYNGALKHLLNQDILLAPMTAKEAALSSKIEGTQATLTEVYKQNAGEDFSEHKLQDIDEINNYCKATYYAVDMLKKKPIIHLNMIKDIHYVLLSGVRGENKARGEFRKAQNWIGPKGSSIENASFVPPAPGELMTYLDDWEKFVNSDYVDLLIQLSLIHAQFEIIHPFLDGNGRLGRILIPLFLFQKGYLYKPAFYLSEYFESNREEYYQRLNDISAHNNWQSWVEFFLNAIIIQSEKNIVKIKEIMDLYEEMKAIIAETTKSVYSQCILDILFIYPIINSTQFAKETKIERKATANSMLQKLENRGIIKLIKEASGNRPNMYAFTHLLNLIEEKDVL